MYHHFQFHYLKAYKNLQMIQILNWKNISSFVDLRVVLTVAIRVTAEEMAISARKVKCELMVATDRWCLLQG